MADEREDLVVDEVLIKKIPYKGDITILVEKIIDRPFSFFLDSSLFHKDRARFSFWGFSPFMVVKSKGFKTWLFQDGSILCQEKNVFDSLRDILKSFPLKVRVPFLPFLGGGVGFFSYDAGFLLEKVELRDKTSLELYDGFFNFYDTIFCYDHLESLLYIISSGFPEKNARLRRARARERLRYFRETLNEERVFFQDTYNVSDIESNFTPQEFLKMVKKALNYIANGDIYEVNLSQCFRARFRGNPWRVYKKLRVYSPSCYSAFFRGDDFYILCSSPEEFLKYENRKVITRPMKGTRPTFSQPQKDFLSRKSLLQSQKEKAELIMVTDLLRNDLGRICKFGSVKVKKLREIERYSTVFQATSTIEGVLRKDRDIIDLITSAFPGGSITGCPKIRAMEIIEELEPHRRSFYTGSLGYISFSQRMHLNIIIRSLFIRGDELYFYVGGGIVYDSLPWREYEETILKAKAIFKTLAVKRPLKEYSLKV